MSFFQQAVEFLKSLINWWFVVEPWEQALRVRFGKHLRLFDAGIHTKIPFFDIIYAQNTRRRVMTIGLQTLTSYDGSVLTLNGSIGYKIVDVLKLHQTLHDAESTVLQCAQGVLARYVATNDLGECTPAKLMKVVGEQLKLEEFGLKLTDFFLSSFVANVRTYRLLSDNVGGYAGGSSLSTGETCYGTIPARASR